MTTTSTHTDQPAGTATDADRAVARRATLPILIGATLVAATLSVADANSVPERFVDVGLELAAGLLLAIVVVPRALRHQSAGGRALGFGIVAVVLVFPAFWSGLPLILGVTAALLGWAGRRGVRRGGLAVAGFALGLFAVVGYAAMYVVDAVIH